jgi:hypothetical protein
MTFTAPLVGPCEPYTTWDDITACGTIPDIDEELQDLVVDVASETIWGLLGERYSGACERTVMPCWRGSCGCYPCGCQVLRRLDLGALPVWGVSSIVIDDVEVDNTLGDMYRVEDWRWLVHLGGEFWPRCQGDWFITLTYGMPIPARARRAASLLGLEFAKQCAGSDCGLDAQTTSYSREGLTVQLAAPSDIIAQGLTGIRTIDLLLTSLGGKGHGGGLLDLSVENRARSVSWTLAEVDA